MADKKFLDDMFSEFDETECVMIAAGEAAIDPDVKEIEDDDTDDDFDETIEDIGQTFTMEDIPAQAARKAASECMKESFTEDLEESVIEMLAESEFDSDVEEIEDDDDLDVDEDDMERYIDECLDC